MNAAEFIYTNLVEAMNAELEGRVYQDVAPENTVFPFIVFQEVSTPPVQSMTADRIADSGTWLIKVYDRSSTRTVVDAIDKLVRERLHKRTAPGILACSAGMRIVREETDSNKNQVKGVFRYYEILTQEE